MRKIVFLQLLLAALHVASAQNTMPDMSCIVSVGEFLPDVDDAAYANLRGPVKRIEYYSDIPHVQTRYLMSCLVVKHHIDDVIQERNTEVLFDTAGAVRSIRIDYTLHSHYFIYDMNKGSVRRWKRSMSPKNIITEKNKGTSYYTYRDGRLVSHSDNLDQEGCFFLKYDSCGNVVLYAKTSSPVDAHPKKQFHFAYDSLNRLVYVDDWSNENNYQGLPHGVYAFQYDSGRCVARIRDWPVGLPKGDLRLLHYEPLPGDSTLLRISYCNSSEGSDTDEYVKLHSDPMAHLDTFFNARMGHCRELNGTGAAFPFGGARSIYPIQLFFTTGDYIFDRDGRLVYYYLQDYSGIISRSTIRYDEHDRIVEMKAHIGTLVGWKGFAIDPDVIGMTFGYDEFGNVESMSMQKKSSEGDAVQQYDWSYTYEYDSYGNWLVKRCLQNGEPMGEERRSIEYY